MFPSTAPPKPEKVFSPSVQPPGEGCAQPLRYVRPVEQRAKVLLALLTKGSKSPILGGLTGGPIHAGPTSEYHMGPWGALGT